jgi:hypothetical protein
MPNWVDNRLQIVGENEHLAEFRKWLAEDCGGEFLFEKFLPIPQELLEHNSPNIDEEKAKEFKSKYGAADWYSWSIGNWGCKWDLKHQDDDFLENFDDYQGFSFETAWSPPIKAIEHLSLKFPNLKFEMQFIDEAWLFWGEAKIAMGESKEVCYEFKDLLHERGEAYRMLVDEFEGGDEEYVDERIKEVEKSLSEIE